MATDRRKFLSLMALGVPATTAGMRQPSLFSFQQSAATQGGSPEIPLDVVSGASAVLGDMTTERHMDVRVVRLDPSDCPPGKIRWAVEIEEPDTKSETLAGKHPSALLVFGNSLKTLYGISLEQAGCRVDSALDNVEALRLYHARGPYDVVLTDIIHLRELFSHIRKENPKQAFAAVGAFSATTIRFEYKIPVLREGPRQHQLVRLVESAIKPKTRVLLVIAKPDACWRSDANGLKGPEVEGYGQVWHMITSLPESFELEFESNGNEALERYRDRGPYDMVLSELRLPGLSGPDLAMAIRSANPAQRIVMITESKSVGPEIQQQLGDIPVINRKNPRTVAAMKRARMMRHYDDGEGKILLDWVEAALKETYKRTTKKRA